MYNYGNVIYKTSDCRLQTYCSRYRKGKQLYRIETNQLSSINATSEKLRETLRELLHKINGDLRDFIISIPWKWINEGPSSRRRVRSRFYCQRVGTRQREKYIYKNIYKIITRVEYGNRMCIYVYTRIFDVCMSFVVMCVDETWFNVALICRINVFT